MGIIPASLVFLLVTAANVINTYYLIKSNEGLKKRQLEVKKGLKIDNDYANLMYQVPTSFFHSFIALWKGRLLHLFGFLLYDCLECDAWYYDRHVRFYQAIALFRVFLGW